MFRQELIVIALCLCLEKELLPALCVTLISVVWPLLLSYLKEFTGFTGKQFGLDILFFFPLAVFLLSTNSH